MKTAIIGAGPAGLFAAANLDGETVVFEKNSEVGKKLNITGKGRCNLTNDCSPDEYLDKVVTNPKFMFGAINAFAPADTIRYFSRFVPLKTERGNRVFPVSDKAQDVTAALYNDARRHADIRLNCAVRTIMRENNGFVVITDNNAERFDNVVVCCGGASYPQTGSTGDGYEIARRLGHTVVGPYSALVPIYLKEDVSSIGFITLKNVGVKLKIGKKSRDFFGDIEFNKKGLCGPLALSISSLINKIDLSDVSISLDLKPALNCEKLTSRLNKDAAERSGDELSSFMRGLLPKEIIGYFLRACSLKGNKLVRTLNVTDFDRIVEKLKNLTFSPRSLSKIESGIVTSGGVNVKEINPKTMESKIAPGLYFAGEVIDVDALTGGFNIQTALSTAYCAARAINNKNEV